jgi:DNA segregation ATPase FtsK/SpoIIIE, S-DNA-T family
VAKKPKSTKAKTSTKTSKPKVDRSHQKAHLHFRLKEVLLIVFSAFALFLVLALVTYHRADPSWSFVGGQVVQNAGGRFGAWCAGAFLSLFGFFGFVAPAIIAHGVWVVYRERKADTSSPALVLMRWIGVALLFVSGASLCTILLSSYGAMMPQSAGGIIGQVLGGDLLDGLNLYGSLLVLIAGVLVGFTLFSGVSWLCFIGWLVMKGYRGIKQAMANWRASRAQASERRAEAKALRDIEKAEEREQLANMIDDAPPKVALTKFAEPAKPAEKISIVAPAKDMGHPDSGAIKPKKEVSTIVTPEFNGEIPSIELLDEAEAHADSVSSEVLEHMAKLVEEKLADFGIKAQVVGVCPGPIVTRYELQLAPGVKVSKLAGLSKDLARALSALSVRVVEVIPGKSVVGIELPNEKRDIVRLKEVLECDDFLGGKFTLPMALGKDIAGVPEVVDLAKMPHLLVAGTTGSGKSVGVNAMIISLLLKLPPDQLRFIMIDPKMLELSIYESIPHLLTPVVTDMKQAANALRWAVREMDRRYKLMAAMGVRNVAGMNDKVREAKEAGVPLKDPLWQQLNPGNPDAAPDMETLPYVVIVVDEFADMIMVVGKKVEELIARIAQKARAAGIHLILATQRPSVDVVTGLIKANIPTRIAFQVSSRIDSRTILDQQGAEQLLGHGDMLYLPPGSGVPTRVHGAFVADHEVHTIVAAWKKLGEPHYIESILTTESEEGDGKSGDSDGEKDPLYDEAVSVVMETGRASISGVQRRLKIGYNRAARLIEEMEFKGIVSEMGPSGQREILVDQQ